MSNDLITSTDAVRVEMIPTVHRHVAGPDGPDRRPPPSIATTPADRRPRPTLEGTLRPFADVDEARLVIGSVRSMLGRHLEGAALADSLLVILCAKVVDETTGDELGFVAVPGQPRVTASRFDAVVAAAKDWLHLTCGETRWPDIEVPELVGHQVMKLLEPLSIMLTAERRDGRAILRALFAGCVDEAGSLPLGSVFADQPTAKRLLDGTAFVIRSERLRTVAVAATEAFGGRDQLKARNLDWMRGNYKRGDLQLTNFPKLIHVELSTQCNLRCRTCSITRPGRERDLTFLPLETLERLRPALPFISDCKLHGGGEPFMHPQIEQVLQVFRDDGVRLNTVSNGVLIRERLARLIGATFSSLTISVDGGDKATYEYVRPRASWDTLLRGFDHVNRFRNPDLRLIVGVVLLKCNIHQLPDLVRFAHDHGAQELQAAWLVPFHDLPWTATQRLTDEPVRTNHYMDEARAVGDELGISVRIPDNLPLVPFGTSPGALPDLIDLTDGAQVDGLGPDVAHPNGRGADLAGEADSTIVATGPADTYRDLHGTDQVEGHCRIMYDRAVILVDGRVKPCGQSRPVPGLGSIQDRSFEACWNGEGYQNLRATFNGGTLPRTCTSCNFIRSKQLGTARLVY